MTLRQSGGVSSQGSILERVMADWSQTWTDEMLYAKYGITEDEISFIEKIVRPMDLTGGDDE